jgi:hypothetical protein
MGDEPQIADDGTSDENEPQLSVEERAANEQGLSYPDEDGMGMPAHETEGAAATAPASQPPSADAEKTGAETTEPATAQLDEEILGYAKQFGMTDEEARGFSSSDALVKEVLWRAKNAPPPQAEPPEMPSATEQPAAGIPVVPEVNFDLDPEKFEPGVVALGKDVGKVLEYTQKSVQQLQEVVGRMSVEQQGAAKARTEATARDQFGRFEAHIGRLVDKHGPAIESALGAGSSRDLQRTGKLEQFGKRRELANLWDVLSESMPEERAMETAVLVLFKDVIIKNERDNLNGQRERRNGAAASRPTHRAPASTPVNPTQAAVAEVRQKLADLGIDDEYSAEPEEELVEQGV